jgi:translation initiation factor 2 subunit 2
MMHRQPEHVLQFVATELNTDATLGGDQQLILKGKFIPKHIEGVLRRYISNTF